MAPARMEYHGFCSEGRAQTPFHLVHAGLCGQDYIRRVPTPKFQDWKDIETQARVDDQASPRMLD